MSGGQAMAVPLEVPLPREEGVYDLLMTVHHAAKLPWAQPGRSPLGMKQQPIAERTVQLIVLGPQAASASSAPPSRLAVVDEIEPAAVQGRPILVKLPQLPGLPRPGKGPLGNGNSQVWTHPLGPLVQLAPNDKAGEISWEAYTLSISRPGEPHVLEVDYPSDVPQTLGISLIEPNAAGAVVPFSSIRGSTWPRKSRPSDRPPSGSAIAWSSGRGPRPRWCLLTNRRDKSPAVFGKNPRARRVAAASAGVSRRRAQAGTAVACLARSAAVARELLRQRGPRVLGRPERGGLADVLRRGHAAGPVPALRRLQRLDAFGVRRLQHDLSQPGPQPRRRVTTPGRISPPAKTRSARTFWKCSCACSTARGCN